MSKSITVRLSDKDIKTIDTLIRTGQFTSRSEFLKAATKKLLTEEHPKIPKLFQTLQRQAKKKHMNRKEIIAQLRKVRKELYQD